MERIFGRPIVTQEQMRTRIRELGRQIASDYAGKDLVLVGVLKGAYAFYADLARAIRIPMRVEFIVVTSYGSGKRSSGKVKLVSDLAEPIAGKDVLLVEDIVDSGLTIQHLIKTMSRRKPRTLKVCTLLSKPERRKVEVDLEYGGFKIPNRFVVGYGLDYQQQYRNLPYLAALDQADEREQESAWKVVTPPEPMVTFGRVIELCSLPKFLKGEVDEFTGKESVVLGRRRPVHDFVVQSV